MALTITIDSIDLTAYVDVQSIRTEQAAESMVAVARFRIYDHSGTVDIDEKDSVTIADGETTLFAGELVDLVETSVGIACEWKIVCQDNNILLDETVVLSESYTVGTADSAIINDLFTSYRSDIDSTTHVATIKANLHSTMNFDAMTLREILDDICGKTGGWYYVDADKNLHYFETETNPAGWNLSTSPNGSTLIAYGGFSRSRSASRLANRVLVKGTGVEGWTQDDASVAAYGARHTAVRDQRISTSDGLVARATAVLDRYDLPRVGYELWTEKDGLSAGMSIEVTNATWGITAETYYIRQIKMEVLSKSGDLRRYHLSLGNSPVNIGRSGRSLSERLGIVERRISISDNVIILYDSGETLVRAFAFTSAGLVSGLAAMTAGDVLKLGVGTITDGSWVLAYGTLKGLARSASILNGQLTISDSTKVENLSVIRSEDDAGTISGLVRAAGSTAAVIVNVKVQVANATGAARALSIASGGRVDVHDTELLAETGSVGYAAYVGNWGELYQYGGRAVGTTALQPYFL